MNSLPCLAPGSLTNILSREGRIVVILQFLFVARNFLFQIWETRTSLHVYISEQCRSFLNDKWDVLKKFEDLWYNYLR